jgi:hypothetical protein
MSHGEDVGNAAESHKAQLIGFGEQNHLHPLLLSKA